MRATSSSSGDHNSSKNKNFKLHLGIALVQVLLLGHYFLTKPSTPKQPLSIPEERRTNHQLLAEEDPAAGQGLPSCEKIGGQQQRFSSPCSCPEQPECAGDEGGDVEARGEEEPGSVATITPGDRGKTLQARVVQDSISPSVAKKNKGPEDRTVNTGVGLAIPHPLVELDVKTGHIKLPTGEQSSSGGGRTTIERICVDVGAHWSAPSSRAWWDHFPGTYVVAIEANPWSAFWLRHFATKHFHDNAYGHMFDETHKKKKMATNAEDDSTGRDGEDTSTQCSARVVQRCIKKGWSHWIENEEKRTIIHAAMVDKKKAGGKSTAGTFGYFHPGTANRSDVGSIFALQRSYTHRYGIDRWKMPKPQIVPLLTLSEVMDYLPLPTGAGRGKQKKKQQEAGAADNDGEQEHEGGAEESAEPLLQWDTLKIDAQGADALVLFGAEHPKKLLSNFLCIIGEFDDDAYDTEGSEYTNRKKAFGKVAGPGIGGGLGGGGGGNRPTEGYHHFLTKTHGFIMIDRRFFVNPRFTSIFLKGPDHYTCRASDVRRSHEAIISALKKAGYTS